MNRLFRDTYNEGGRDESLATSSFAPAVDVYEDEHNVTLKVEVPGIGRKRYQHSPGEQHLLYRARPAQDRKRRKRRELSPCGATVRQLHSHLYSADDRGCRAVAATYDKGVLNITLPKKAEAKPKQIKVNVGSAKGEKTLEAKGPSKAA